MKPWIDIDVNEQRLSLKNKTDIIWKTGISTALNGVGELQNSGCTPLGEFAVKLKIGESCPLNSVFVGRRATGEIYSAQLANKYPQRDWILTRILWLTGCDVKNRGGNVDTLRRFIYIHGCPDTEPMGVPLSHGCVRMRNHDVLTLFDQVSVADRVLIHV
jgi:L,D-transpeptidase YbiS